MICSTHKQPTVKGSYIAYEVTDTEHNFWKKLSNQERTKLRDEALKRCFYDVLREYMSNKGRLFHEGRSS
jgi:hypothetical protein